MEKFNKNEIVPTENDAYFRNQLLHGYVHDMGAAMQGGVGGHAGLFSNANDVAKIMQMYLQKGFYGGKRFLKSKTVSKFNKRYYADKKIRRGLGFDKPLIGNDTLPIKKAYPAPEVSPKSFGHSGFTGTFVWADPEHELVFIFLSNRVYPHRSHRNIYNLNIRPKVQQVFYQAMSKSK